MARVKHSGLIRDLDELFGGDEWLDTVVTCFARRPVRATTWYVVFSDFSSVSGHGASLHEAFDAAASKFVIEIKSTAQRSRGSFSLDELRQPLETSRRMKWEFGAFLSRVLRLVPNEPTWWEVESLRVPLGHALCLSGPDVMSAGTGYGGREGEDVDAALMAEGYRELAEELHEFAEASLVASTETLPH